MLEAEGAHIADLFADPDGTTLAGAYDAALAAFSSAWTAAGSCSTNATEEGIQGDIENLTAQLVDTTIVTPGVGDRPIFMSTEMGKFMLQFKSFFLAAHNQMAIPMAQKLARGDYQAFEGLVMGCGCVCVCVCIQSLRSPATIQALSKAKEY